MRFGFRRRKREKGSGKRRKERAVIAEQALVIRRRLDARSPVASIVLVGLMGAGKTSVGRRLAARLDLPFTDADREIEAAAGKTIAEIFADHGEAYFRAGEHRVIARLLGGGPQVLATGGGAFMNAKTRGSITEHGVSVWLRADIEVLLERVLRRNTRPLLRHGDPLATMQRLVEERYPIYAEADITVESRDAPHDAVVGEIMQALTTTPVLDASHRAC